MMNIEDQTRNPLYMLNKTWNDDDDDTVCTENSIKTDKKNLLLLRKTDKNEEEPEKQNSIGSPAHSYLKLNHKKHERNYVIAWQIT